MKLTFDKIASLSFFAISLFFIFESRKISTSAYGSVVGPNIFPLVLGIILLILSIQLFIESLRKHTEHSTTEYDYKRFLLTLLVTIFYVLVFAKLGYILSTFLFLFITFQIIERGNYIKSLIISACFSGGIYYLFVILLQGTLPTLL